MKRLLPILLLLAPACFGQGQDSVRAVGGVLTINLVPSASRYKVFVDQTITSTVFTNPIPAAVITVLFVQDATGHTVAFGGNISGGCTVTSTASATTGCQFTFDSANNQWTGVGGSGGVTSLAGSLCSGSVACVDVTAAPYNAKFKVKRSNDGTWTSGANPTTVTSAAGLFLAADFPASFKGVSSGSSLCSNLGTAIFVNATTISVTCAGNGVGNPTGNGVIAWGPDDSAAINSATTAALALCSLYRTVQIALPAGTAFIGQGQAGAIPAGCTASPGTFVGGSSGFSTIGPCRTCTVLIPIPGFNFSTGGAAGCFWDGAGGNNSAGTYKEGFTIDGLTENLSGISTSPCSTMFSSAISGGTKHIGLVNWGTSASPIFRAYQANNQAGPNIDIQIDKFGDSNAGCSTGAEMHAGFAGGGLVVGGGQSSCNDYGQWYGGDNPANSVVINLGTIGSVLRSFGTVIQGIGSNTAGIFVQASGATAYFDGLVMPSSVPVNSPMLDFTAAGTVYMKDSQLLGGTTAGSCTGSVGTVVNLGGNVYQGGPWLCTNTYVDLSGTFPTPISCTGVATSSQPTIAIPISGLTAAGAGIPSTCTGTTADAGKVMPKAGTILALIAKSSAAGSTAGSGVVSVLKNGVAQSMTCTFGTTTACNDGTTAHQVTVAQNDRISVTLSTGAGETLANVQVTLVVW